MNLFDIKLDEIELIGKEKGKTVFCNKSFYYKIFKVPETNQFLYNLYKKNFISLDCFCGRHVIRDNSIYYLGDGRDLASFELKYFTNDLIPAFNDVIHVNNTVVGYITCKGEKEYTTKEYEVYLRRLIDHSISKNIIIPDIFEENIFIVNNKLSLIDLSDLILEIPKIKDNKFFQILNHYKNITDIQYFNSVVQALKI